MMRDDATVNDSASSVNMLQHSIMNDINANYSNSYTYLVAVGQKSGMTSYGLSPDP